MKVRAMKFKELEQIIKSDGWHLLRVDGSHHQYAHSEKIGLVTIPRHPGDIDPYVVKSVLKQAGLS